MEMQTKELAMFEKTKAIMRSDEVIQRFAEVLGTERTAKKYIGSVLLAVGQNDNLQQCTPQSIMISGMRAATLKLTVDPALGHAYMVPYKDKATFILGYKGLMQLALRTGKYRHINVATVYDGQEVEEDQLKGIHTIKGLPKYDRKKWVPIGYMLYFELRDGYSKTFYMTCEEIEEHGKKYSKGYDKFKKEWRNDSTWKTDFENMAKKTVIRLGLSRYGYFDADDYLAMNESDEVVDEELQDDFIDGELLDSALEQEEARRHQYDDKTTEELSALLGFEDEPDTSKKLTPAQKKKQDAIDGAGKFISKRLGKTYGKMTPEELQGELMLLTQYDPKGQEEKMQVNDRIQACKILIAYLEENQQ